MASEIKNEVGDVTESDAPPAEASKSHDDDICELEHLRKLFIGGLAPYTTEEGLKEFYGQWGKVVDVVVMRDPTTKRSRGFGFITYTKSSMVDKAQENRPHIIDGKTVEAKRALPRPERESRETNISVKKLFVGGLKDNHDEECLKEYFSQFGNVVSVKILTDKTTGKRRGFAFIEFDDYDAVDKAILQKNHSIKYVIVDVKKSVYNQEKQQRQNNTNAVAPNNGNQAKQPLPPPAPANASGPPPPPGYRPPPPQQAMPPYQQPPPMQPGPMPPNYGYWGPPPPAAPPQYGANAYQQPPPPHMNGWNYPPAPNAWNAGPPPPPAGAPPPASWYPNQWGCPPLPGPQPPAAPPAAVPPPANWNAAPVPPPNPPTVAPTQPPPQQAPPNNFGTGYQQNYGGGPTKHNNMNANRMNPYSGPPNTYANNGQPPAAPYGGYNANSKPAGNMPPVAPGPGAVPKPTSNGSAPMAAAANKYRR